MSISTHLSYHHVKTLEITEIKTYIRDSDSMEFQSLTIILHGEDEDRTISIGIYNDTKDGGIKVIDNNQAYIA